MIKHLKTFLLAALFAGASAHAAQQVINTGTTANDGTGDTVRQAFSKANANFTELYTGKANIANTLAGYGIGDAYTKTEADNRYLQSLTCGTGLSGGVVTSIGVCAVLYGTTANTAAAGNDSRLSDQRTPVDASVTNAKLASGAVTDDKASLATKPAVAVVATSNLTLSGVQTIDGFTGVAGTTLVLATAQTTGSQNGPWLMQSGAWTRPSWYSSGSTTQAAQFIEIKARLGTSWQNTTWRQTAAAPITIDTTPTTWVVTPYALNASTVTGTLPRANLPNLKFVDGVTPQIIATRGLTPGTVVQVAGVTLHETRLQVKNGPRPARNIQLILQNFGIDLTGLGEFEVPTNAAVTMLAAVEKLGTTNFARLANVGGLRTIPVDAGAGFILSEPIGVTLDANELFKVQFEGRFAAGASVLAPVNAINKAADLLRSSLSTGQIGTAGTWSTTSRTAGVPANNVVGVIGIPDRAYPSVVILGDSIANSRDDTVGDAVGNAGFIPRGLYDPKGTGEAVPWIRAAQSGEKMNTVQIGGLSRRLTLLRYCSHVIENYGTNDLGSDNASLATLQSRSIAAWQMMKQYNVKIYHVLMMPRTTSTDNWATVANQTPVAGYEIGGIRDQFNAWVQTQVGTYIDGVIDPNVYLEDQTTKGRWVANGTAQYATLDGIHPSPAGHALAVPSVTSVASTFTLQ